LRCLAAAAVVVGTLSTTNAVFLPSAEASSAGCAYHYWRSFKKGTWRWNNSRITYFVNFNNMPAARPHYPDRPYSASQIVHRFESGARTWADIRNHCHFRRASGPYASIDHYATNYGTNNRATDRGVNVLDFGGDDPGGKTFAGGECIAGVIACTKLWHHGHDLSQASVRVSTAYDYWTSLRAVPKDGQHTEYYDLYSVIAHEMGHMWGIAHPTEDQNAQGAVREQLMFPTVGRTEVRRFLAGSDYTALCTMAGC